MGCRSVEGKRNLFDNVVNPDATGDVVGVSRKLVEILTADLAALAEVEVAGAPGAGGGSPVESPVEPPVDTAPGSPVEPDEGQAAEAAPPDLDPGLDRGGSVQAQPPTQIAGGQAAPRPVQP